MPEVFISYAHADDQSFAEGLRGWVTSLVDRLEKSLAMKPGGAGVRVWMDHRLEPNKRVDPALAARVGAADAFVAVLSPRYLESPWCREEIEGFARRGGVQAERVFLVEMAPTDRAQWPASLANLPTCEFWTRASDEPAPMPLGWPAPDPIGDRDYWRAVNKLSHFISGRLVSSVAAPAGQRRVWIADPTDHVLDHWEALAAGLRQQGATVLPATAGAYPVAAEAGWRAALADDLAQADVLVQLLGPHPGRRPAWADRPLSHLQAEAARACAAQRGVPLLVWRPADVVLDGIHHAEHRELLTGSLASDGETLLAEVLARLNPPQRQAALVPEAERASPAGGADMAPAIYVQADEADRALGDHVCKLLFELGAEPTLASLPTEAQSPAEWRQHYESSLADSSGLLIVYGNSPPSWVQAQVQAARKTLARMRPKLWGGLLDAPPGTQPDHGVRSHGLMLLDCRAGLSPEPLQRLIQALRAAGG